MKPSIRIKVPATSANLGPGFDTLGMALNLFNRFEAEPDEQMSVHLSPYTCVETQGLSLNPSENLLAQAYQAYYKFRDEAATPAKLTIEAHVPLSRGLGSSSSAIVGGLFLANCLHPKPLSKTDLLKWAVEMEGHPDNVAPALMGGVQCCLSNGQLISLVWPKSWGIVLVIPPTPLSTHQARSVMPQHYSIQDAVETLRGMAAWIYALDHQDADLFREALQSDRLHEPARARLIPEFNMVKQSLKETNALGTVISGAGSSIAVFTPSPESTQATLKQLADNPVLAHCKVISIKPDVSGCQRA